MLEIWIYIFLLLQKLLIKIQIPLSRTKFLREKNDDRKKHYIDKITVQNRENKIKWRIA